MEGDLLLFRGPVVRQNPFLKIRFGLEHWYVRNLRVRCLHGHWLQYLAQLLNWCLLRIKPFNSRYLECYVTPD